MTDELALLLLAGAALALKERGMQGKVNRGPNVKPEDQVRILDALESLGWPRNEVHEVIRRESGWRTYARNPNSTAAGLIQMMGFTLAHLGFYPDLSGSERANRFAALTAREQLPWIVKYFSRYKWRIPGDTYLAVAAPGFLGKPDDAIVYPIGSRAWQLNAPLRSIGDGPITAGSIRALVR